MIVYKYCYFISVLYYKLSLADFLFTLYIASGWHPAIRSLMVVVVKSNRKKMPHDNWNTMIEQETMCDVITPASLAMYAASNGCKAIMPIWDFADSAEQIHTCQIKTAEIFATMWLGLHYCHWQTKTRSCHSTRHSIRTLILQPVISGWTCRRRWWQPILSSPV